MTESIQERDSERESENKAYLWGTMDNLWLKKLFFSCSIRRLATETIGNGHFCSLFF